ncbi:glycerol-3-phosphate acyltransferase [Ferdinandcohnia quinoae]|uniref:Glycerol-3-phosphate acyltransferase n=1 Tax=Fredinandcohnia quinoae TaxID=2918902 RepID=A0AAW5ECM4_9BACI|nr:glycerol-3-phosphate acyltransferase [Fredinandcohnia sp. SECRCQ15]
MYFIGAMIIGYLIGCIHGSQIIGKLKGVNIKQSGVKNAGASNTMIVLGWKYGIIVALIDIGKAVLPIVIGGIVLNDADLINELQVFILYIVGAAVIIGHNYPFTMNFSGGKGTASMVGLILALDWKIGLISIGILIITAIVTDYLVVGVFLMYITFTITTFVFDHGIYPTMIALFLFLLSVYKHVENIKRIKNKTEVRISGSFKKKK